MGDHSGTRWQHLPEVMGLPIDVYGGLANFDDDVDGLEAAIHVMKNREWGEDDEERDAGEAAARLLEPIARRLRAARA